jgi:dihydroflavonol-4-reductase
MAVLLTGASGLLGANLAHRLCARGVKPRLLLRPRSNRRALRGLSFEDVTGDILDRESLAAAMRGVEEVYHVAGLVPSRQIAKEELQRINVEGTLNVMEAARAAKVRRVVHVSSIVAVGHGPLSAPATEDSPYNYDASNNLYSWSKREGEAVALTASGNGMEVVVGNPSTIVGAYDTRSSSVQILLPVARGAMRAYPLGGNNFVNATDVAEGLILLMQRGRPGERYILGGENLTYRELLTQCAEEAGVPPPAFPLPDAMLRTAIRIGTLLSKVSPARFAGMASPFLAELMRPLYVSSQKARRELGYRPGPVRRGIRDGYRWLQEEGLLPRDQPLSPHGTLAQ